MMMVRNTFQPLYKHRLLVYLALTLAWVQQARTQSVQSLLAHNYEEVISSLYLDKPYVIFETFGFDINLNNFYDHLTIHENVSSSLFPGGVSGGLKLVKGDSDQPHSFIVLVRALSSSEDALDFISISNDTYSVYLDSRTPSLGSSDPSDGPLIAIDIVIFVKTHVMQFGHTNIFTTNLDIDIWQDLDYETYHMNLSTIHGSITGIESLYFTAHEISISSEHGSILGNWSLPSRISFTTTNGDIDINLIPKRWSSGPWTRADLSAVANSGDIAIRMPFEKDKLSLSNGTTRIKACNGSINGTFVHGAVTSLMASNSITATLLPQWAFSTWGGRIDHNFITTEARHGNTEVEVLSPVINQYYKINPLFLAVSKHTQRSRPPPSSTKPHMKVTYPGEWGGTAVGHAGVGVLVDISGEDYEEIERNRTMLKVQRRPLGSELWFEADTGTAELHLNPCFSPACAFQPK
jgi:hypothetical protein